MSLLETDSIQVIDEQKKDIESNTIEDNDSIDEGSGNVPTLDFGDITEVVL